MSEPINLADPAFEPTDEQLMGLSKRAFAGVKEANEVGRKRLRAEIAARRRAVMWPILWKAVVRALQERGR